MAEKYHFMFHKTDKTLRGYAKLLAQSRYTPGDVQELFGGDYKKLFPRQGTSLQNMTEKSM